MINRDDLRTNKSRLVVGIFLSGAIYVAFSYTFPLTKYYNVIPPLDYTKLTDYSLLGFFAYIFGISILFGIYIWAIKRIAQGQLNLSIHAIFITSAFFALILVFSYPQTAIDIFIYAIRTRGWALYDLQPLATAPEMLPATDPWLGLAGEWLDAPSPYGPVWEWLSLGAFYLVRGNFLGHLFALKGIAVLSYLGCSWLIFLILRERRPDWTRVGLIAFAWNPLVLFESAQNGHNDIVMAFFLVVAIWAYFKLSNTVPDRNRVTFANLSFCVFMAASILVKFVTIAVLPFFLLGIAMQKGKWHQRVLTLLGYGGAISLLLLLGMLPLWPSADNWAVLTANLGAGRSLMALLVLSLKNTLGTNPAFDLARGLLYAVCIIIFLYFTWRILNKREQSITGPISGGYFLLFFYVLLAAPTFHAWYLLWFLPLGSLLLPKPRPLLSGIVFSITALYAIPYFETVRVWFPVLLKNHLLGHIIGVTLLIIPPILALIRPFRLAAIEP